MIETILSLSEFKADASRLLDQIRDEEVTLVLTQNGRARAVVQDYEQHRRQQDALLLLKLMVQGERDVREGQLEAQDLVFDRARRRLIGDEPGNG